MGPYASFLVSFKDCLALVGDYMLMCFKLKKNVASYKTVVGHKVSRYKREIVYLAIDSECFSYLGISMKGLKAPSVKTVIHSFPWPVWLTHPSHPFPFLPFHPTHWHIPSSVLPIASKTPTSDTHLSRSGNTEGHQTIFTLCKNPSKIKNLFFSCLY